MADLDTDEQIHSDNQKSAHSQYTDAYVSILNTYKDQLSKSIDNKNHLKKDFFKAIRALMFFMAFIFAIAIISSMAIMYGMIKYDNHSAEVIAGAMVSIISSFVTMTLGIYKLPQIIADYLFNKKEDKQMQAIISNIQKYELDADNAERLRQQAKMDAVLKKVKTIAANEDSNMNDSEYEDSGDSVSAAEE